MTARVELHRPDTKDQLKFTRTKIITDKAGMDFFMQYDRRFPLPQGDCAGECACDCACETD